MVNLLVLVRYCWRLHRPRSFAAGETAEHLGIEGGLHPLASNPNPCSKFLRPIALSPDRNYKHPLSATGGRCRSTKGLRSSGKRLHPRLRTVIHRKALEKTCCEAENSGACIYMALQYFFGGPAMKFILKTRTRCAFLIVALAFLPSTLPLSAQAIYGSIYGQVTDPSGAAIPNATITVSDESKGTSVQTTSNQSGEYTVPNLIPDVYDVKAEAAGFSPVENRGIQVSADTSPKVDLQLSVGVATESVTVTTAAPQLQTDRADVGTVFNQRTISDLPIQGRNFASLQLLIPGAQSMGWTQNNAEDSQGSPTVNIQGQFFAGVGYLLDGASNQDPILGQIVINPPLDAIGEAKISTQSYDAEFGQSVAAVVSAQTKSGTNDFHGDVFDYRRSGANLARNPFNQFAPYSALSPRLAPPALYSQFGGSIGGPILKNKAFFFGDYQGLRQRNGASAQETVPTARAHNSCLSGNGCDFSEFLTGRGALQGQIYNPRVVNPLTGPVPFVNNFIPSQYLSSQALYLLKLIPLPNSPGTQDGTANNYNAGGTGATNQNQFDVRVDYELRQSVHTFGRYSYFDNKNSASTIFGAAGGAGFSSSTNDFGGSATGRNQSAVTGMEIGLNPKLLTDFRLGYLRYHVSTDKYDGTQNLATMAGIPGLNLGTTFTAGAPGFFMNNTSGASGDGLP